MLSGTEVQIPILRNSNKVVTGPTSISPLQCLTTNHEPRTTNHEPRTTNHEPQITNHKSRITNHESQITNHKSRITNHESQITNHKSQITNHKSRITNHKSRITNHESQITNHKSRPFWAVGPFRPSLVRGDSPRNAPLTPLLQPGEGSVVALWDCDPARRHLACAVPARRRRQRGPCDHACAIPAYCRRHRASRQRRLPAISHGNSRCTEGQS